MRGGIIADEMGLGKNVISLALILENPAPTLPQSGSSVSALNANNSSSSVLAVETQSLWDKDLYSRTSASNSKRGIIISRGTLVVVRMWLTFYFCADDMWLCGVETHQTNSSAVNSCSATSRSWDSGLTRRKKSWQTHVSCIHITATHAEETPRRLRRTPLL